MITKLNSMADEYLTLDDEEQRLHTRYMQALNIIKKKKALLISDITDSIGKKPVIMKLDNAEIIQKSKTRYSIQDRAALNNSIMRNPELITMYKSEVVTSKVEELLPELVDEEAGPLDYGLNKNIFITTNIKHKR